MNIEGTNYTMSDIQKLQQYVDMAKIDYYSGSSKGLQEMIFQATGDYIPLHVIEEYLSFVGCSIKRKRKL